jgi:hypothetical protein
MIKKLNQKTTNRIDNNKKKSINMHDDIAVWCDCCSCEAEPYWAELAEEMGIDLDSDYEDTNSD